MISSTVSNAIMNSSQLGEFDVSQSDIDSSFIEAPHEDVEQATPRTPLSRVKDINTHYKSAGIHSGAKRVPTKDKTPGKAARTPTSKRQNRAGYLATTEAFRNSAAVNSPARIPFKSSASSSAADTPSRSSPTRSSSTPPSTKRSSSRPTSGHADTTKHASSGASATIVQKGSVSTPVKSSTHPTASPHAYRSPASAMTGIGRVPLSSKTQQVHNTPPTTHRSSGQKRTPSSAPTTSPARHLSAAPSSSSPGADVFLRLTAGLPTRHTAPAVPMTKKHAHSRKGLSGSTPTSTPGKKSKIPVSNSRSSGTPKSATPSPNQTVSAAAKNLKGGVSKSSQSALRPTIASQSKQQTLSPSATSGSSKAIPSSRPYPQQQQASKSLLRGSNASSSSLPPAMSDQNMASKSDGNCQSNGPSGRTSGGHSGSFPRPPPSLDFTLSESSFSINQLMMPPSSYGNATHIASSRNISSEWADANISALSPICRMETTSETFMASQSYVITSDKQEQEIEEPSGDDDVKATSSFPTSLYYPSADPNTTNDSDLTMTTVGSAQPAGVARPIARPPVQSSKTQHAPATVRPRPTRGGSVDLFPEDVSVVEQDDDDSRSSSPRSLLSGGSACWTQASELSRFPANDSRSLDEAFFLDMINRRSTTRTPFSGEFPPDPMTRSSSGTAGNRKTYMDDALQNEMRTSSASLGTTMFAQHRAHAAAATDQSKAEEDSLLNDSSSMDMDLLAAAGLSRGESQVFGATDIDGLSIDTRNQSEVSDVLNTALIRGSSFTSMLSTTSSMSSVSMFSPSMGSMFSPRAGGAVGGVDRSKTKRAPSHQYVSKHQQIVLNDSSEQDLGEDEEDAIEGNMKQVDMHAEETQSHQMVSADGQEYSFSLSRQNSDEIVENHDSDVDCSDNDDCDEDDADADDCVRVPKVFSSTADRGLLIDTDRSQNQDVSEEQEGDHLYLANLSQNESDTSAAISALETPLSSTLSVLNKGFFNDVADAVVNDVSMERTSELVALKKSLNPQAKSLHQRSDSKASVDSLRYELSLPNSPPQGLDGSAFSHASDLQDSGIALLRQELDHAPVASLLHSQSDGDMIGVAYERPPTTRQHRGPPSPFAKFTSLYNDDNV